MLLHRNRKIQRATWAVGVWGRILYRLSEVKVMKNVDRNFDYSASKAKLSFGLNSVGNTEPLGLVCNRSSEHALGKMNPEGVGMKAGWVGRLHGQHPG